MLVRPVREHATDAEAVRAVAAAAFAEADDRGWPRERVDLLDSVDRRLRGGAHGADHTHLLRDFPLLVCDDLAGSGYCYFDPGGKIELLAATSRRLAPPACSPPRSGAWTRE